MRRLSGCIGLVGVWVVVATAPALAQFSLPTINVTDCSSPVVNISTTEAGTTLGFDFEVAFDSSVVAVADVTLPGITSECEFAFNPNIPGAVSISIACTVPVSGSGVLAAIQFVPTGSGSTGLTFADCSIDEVDCGSATNGSVAMSGCPVIDLSAGGNGAYGLSPGRVCLAGSLASNGSAVAAASTEITFDSSKFGIESCFISPSASGVGKSLSRTVLGAGNEQISISGGAASIPDGTLFVCTLTIVSSVADGSYTVNSVPSATNAASTPLPTLGNDGVLHVTSCAADCNGSGSVRINEVSRTSGLFLGDPLCNASNPALSCPNADMVTVDGTVKINEVSRASCLFLNGTCSKTCP